MTLEYEKEEEDERIEMELELAANSLSFYYLNVLCASPFKKKNKHFFLWWDLKARFRDYCAVKSIFAVYELSIVLQLTHSSVQLNVMTVNEHIGN